MIFHTMGASLVASVLLLLAATGKGALVAVPAPSNLSVGCHNFEAIAKWSYAGDCPSMLFKVQVERDIKHEGDWNEDPQTVYTQQHHYDVSSLITVDNNYRFRVKAVNGSWESDYVISSEFSYNKFMPTDVRCSLEFPPVNLSIWNGQIAVRFVHPFHVYKHSSVLQHLKKDAPKEYRQYKAFEYSITVAGVKNIFECHAADTVCKATFPFLEAMEVYCVTLEGILKDTIVRSSEVMCKREEDQSCCAFFVLPVTLCAAAVAVVLLVAALTLFCNFTKAPPKITTSAILNLRHQFAIIAPEEQPRISLILLTDEEVLQVETAASSTALCFHTDWECTNESSGDRDLADPRNVLDRGHSLGEYESKSWEVEEDSVGSVPRAYERHQMIADIQMTLGDMAVDYRNTTT